MFSKQERRKRKYKSGRNKACKAEEVRKHSVNPKIESFRLVCKLHYLQFGFRMYRSSRLQILFGREALKNFAMFTVKYLCWSFFFNKWLIPMAASGNILWTFSLHMRMMNGVIAWYVLALQRLFHFIVCISFLSVSFFFSYFFCGFYCLLR